jgi:hypothetical protein
MAPQSAASAAAALLQLLRVGLIIRVLFIVVGKVHTDPQSTIDCNRFSLYA